MLPSLWDGEEEILSMTVMVKFGLGLMKWISQFAIINSFHCLEIPGSPTHTEPSGKFQQLDWNFNEWTIQWGFIWGSAAMKLVWFDF